MNYTVEQVVQAIYKSALGRDADREGLENYCNLLSKNPNNLTDVASEFYYSAEHQQKFSSSSAIMDHSQHGEFLKILRYLAIKGSTYQLMVDVGARGRDRSNSYDLLRYFDWKALLVEANPALHQSIHSEFSGTDSILVPYAVGPEEGILPFYIGANDDVSSLLEDAAKGWGDLRGKVDVEVRRLSSILDEHKVPYDFDILSLDIEGMDMPVLNDLIDNSNYRPALVIIEASYDFQTTELSQVNASTMVKSTYKISDITKSNLFLTLI